MGRASGLCAVSQPLTLDERGKACRWDQRCIAQLDRLDFTRIDQFIEFGAANPDHPRGNADTDAQWRGRNGARKDHSNGVCGKSLTW